MRPIVGTFVVKPAAPMRRPFFLRGPSLFLAELPRSVDRATTWPRVIAMLVTWMTIAFFPAAGWANTHTAKEYPPCTEKADDAAVQAARGAFEAGKAAFNETDYPRAILYWEDAFRRDCSAVLLLKNLARAYEAHAQYPEAAVALRTYLTRAPDAEDKAELEAQLQAIEAKIADTKAKQPPGPAPSSATRPATSASHAGHNGTPDANATASESPEEFATESPAESPTNTSKVVAGVIAGTGAAVAMASAVFWFDANAQEKKANEVCPVREECTSPEATRLGNEAIDDQQRWAIVGGVGAALVAGGIIWYLAAPSEADDAGLSPQLGPDYAGVTWTSGF